jgi:hypothetical protein
MRMLEHLFTNNWLIQMMNEERYIQTDPGFEDFLNEKRNVGQFNELLLDRIGRTEVELIIEKMLRFLGEFPVDKFHDFRKFRHKGLRGYLINQFMKNVQKIE